MLLRTRKTGWLIVGLIMCCLFVSLPLQIDAAKMNDVKTSHANYKEINYVVDKKYMPLIQGNFVPDAFVTELQFLQMIAKMDAGLRATNTPTAIIKHYNGINLPLMAATKAANRENPITRAQFATYYAALRGKDYSLKQAIQYLYLSKVTSGVTGKRTYEDYKQGNLLTRKELAVFLYNISKTGGLTVKGLNAKMTGRDNSEITLPKQFTGSNGTVTIPLPSATNTNASSNHPLTFSALQSIKVKNQELVANGKDTTLVKVKLKDGNGQEIAQNESLEFKVTSNEGAVISSTGNNYSNKLTTVKSDGGDLAFYVTAPMLNKTVRDVITLQLVNNTNEKYAIYTKNTININLRYIPKAELQITYEVYDPDQPDWTGGNVGEQVKPLAPLPTAEVANGQSIITIKPDNGSIEIESIDRNLRTFNGTKYETYSLGGQTFTDYVYVKDAMYENAAFRFNGRPIPIWLFEEIIEKRYEAGYDPVVNYSLDSTGNPLYSIPSTIPSNFDELDNLTDGMETMKYLLDEYIPSALNEIKIYHYESIMAIMDMYLKLSDKEKADLNKFYSDTISDLDAIVKKVGKLKENELLASRPSEMKKFTKVMVNLVMPGGRIVTDYKGMVDVEFNGKVVRAKFTDNTVSGLNNTGSAGTATVYFDDLVYGVADVKATLVSDDIDSRYVAYLGDLINVNVNEEIFTNYKFDKNSCKRTVALAVVMDQSVSMRKAAPDEYLASKTKQFVRQMNAKTNIVVDSTTTASVTTRGTVDEVLAQQSLFMHSNAYDKATDLSTGIQVAYNELQKVTDTADSAKAIVVISDGKSMTNNMQAVLNRAKAAGIKVYAIALGRDEDANLTVMKNMATSTDGAYFQVTDVENIHGSYQAILDMILCQTVAYDKLCTNAAVLFENTGVAINSSNITMATQIRANCQVSAVDVVFKSDHGSIVYNLVDRRQNLYNLTIPLSQISNYALYTEVEFIAYNENGQVIVKTQKIQ